MASSAHGAASGSRDAESFASSSRVQPVSGHSVAPSVVASTASTEAASLYDEGAGDSDPPQAVAASATALAAQISRTAALA